MSFKSLGRFFSILLRTRREFKSTPIWPSLTLKQLRLRADNNSRCSINRDKLLRFLSDNSPTPSGPTRGTGSRPCSPCIIRCWLWYTCWIDRSFIDYSNQSNPKCSFHTLCRGPHLIFSMGGRVRTRLFQNFYQGKGKKYTEISWVTCEI